MKRRFNLPVNNIDVYRKTGLILEKFKKISYGNIQRYRILWNEGTIENYPIEFISMYYETR